MQVQGPFDALPIPRKELPLAEGAHYRIYKDAKDYVVVAANTVLEALQASGLQGAFKVERDSFDGTAVLGMGDWKKIPPMMTDPAAAPAAEAAAPAAAAENPQPTA